MKQSMKIFEMNKRVFMK